MNSQELQQFTLEALDELKAQAIQCLDVRDLTSITDSMIICEGTSQRHIKSIANHLVEQAKKNDHPPLGVEWEGGWILVDLGDAVVHIMMPEQREFYQLEKLWTAVESARASNP